MAATGDFQHYSNGGPVGRSLKYGFPGGTGLENIAMGQWDVNSAFSTWRGSGGHWASIVSATTDAGFGYAVGRNGMAYWVGTYGNGTYVSYPSPAGGPEHGRSSRDRDAGRDGCSGRDRCPGRSDRSRRDALSDRNLSGWNYDSRRQGLLPRRYCF